MKALVLFAEPSMPFSHFFGSLSYLERTCRIWTSISCWHNHWPGISCGYQNPKLQWNSCMRFCIIGRAILLLRCEIQPFIQQAPINLISRESSRRGAEIQSHTTAPAPSLSLPFNMILPPVHMNVTIPPTPLKRPRVHPIVPQPAFSATKPAHNGPVTEPAA